MVVSQGSQGDYGDLRLTALGDSLDGSLLLESSDSTPDLVTGVVREDSLEFRSSRLPQLVFVGMIEESTLEGQLLYGGRVAGTWRATRLDPDEEVYIPLPRFTVRQVVGGLNQQVLLPGAWLAAARSGGFDRTRLMAHYREAAVRAGLSPLGELELPSLGLLRAMGVYHREEMRSRAITDLRTIRSGLDSDTAVARFDHLFRSGSNWVVDLHDRAVVLTRRKFPEVSWELVTPALIATGVVRDPPEGTALAPLALYRLYVMQQTDTLAFAEAVQLILSDEPDRLQPVMRLLRSYHEAVDWFLAAVRFLSVERWVAGASPAGMLTDLAGWSSDPFWTAGAELPEVAAHLFGYPDGGPKVGIQSTEAAQLVVPRNYTAQQWLARYGMAEFLSLLERVPFESTPTVVDGEEPLQVIGYAERRDRPTGFLEPTNTIVVDPSYLPLWALGTVLHEWVHIQHENARGTMAFEGSPGVVRLNDQPNPFLAEGMAEVLAQEVLDRLATTAPFTAVGEMEKRASLAAGNRDDPHAVGADLIASLLHAVPDTSAMLQLLASHLADPERVQEVPQVARWLSGYQGEDRLFDSQATGFIIPETTLVLDGGHPLVEERRFLPVSSASR